MAITNFRNTVSGSNSAPEQLASATGDSNALDPDRNIKPLPQVEEVDPPIEEKLAADSSLHRKILTRLNARLNLSYDHMQTRFDSWDRVDDHVRSFIDLSRKAVKVDGTTDQNKTEHPFQRGVVVPATFAMLQVRLVQEVGLLTARQPIDGLRGVGIEDIQPAKLMEAVLDYDAQKSNRLPLTWSVCQDAEKYGLGIIYDCWQEEYGWKRSLRPGPPGSMNQSGIPMLIPSGERSWEKITEYGQWVCVDPYLYYPDPRLPVCEVQNSEFAGHRFFRSFSHLIENSQERGGNYFNVKFLRRGGSAGIGPAESTRVSGQESMKDQNRRRARFSTESLTMRGSIDDRDRGFYALDHIAIKLIPEEWDLGPGDTPEIWIFTLADERIIIRAHPMPNDHGRLPYSVIEPNPDQHALFNQGSAENMDGLQRFMNWLFNSHMSNTMRGLNDALVYMASCLEEADLRSGGPMRHIRLTQYAEDMVLGGTAQIGSFYQQLGIQDLTKGHLETYQMLFDMAQRLMASNDPQMGQPTSEKRTLGEVQSIMAAASQRIAMITRVMDAQGFAPTIRRHIQNRQQFTDLEKFFQITGDLSKELGGMERLLVNRYQMQGDFDYQPITGTMASDPAREAELWRSIFQTVVAYPPFQQPSPIDGKQFDVREVFNEMVRKGGARDVERFWRQMTPPPPPPQVLPDDQVEQGAQMGDMVPMPPPPRPGAPGSQMTGPQGPPGMMQ